jgi:TrpR-related protein YerC/YecD
MIKRFTENNWRRQPHFRQLVKAMLGCRTQLQMANFLRDVATLSELQALSERLEVARLLGSGQTYRGAQELTGASTTTVSRVARFLADGEGGYRTVLGLHHRWVPSRLAYENRVFPPR